MVRLEARRDGPELLVTGDTGLSKENMVRSSRYLFDQEKWNGSLMSSSPLSSSRDLYARDARTLYERMDGSVSRRTSEGGVKDLKRHGCVDIAVFRLPIIIQQGKSGHVIMRHSLGDNTCSCS